MTQPTVIKFVDAQQGDAVAIVRSAPGVVQVTLSVQSNGDTAVSMPLSDAEKLSKALLLAIKSARNISNGD